LKRKEAFPEKGGACEEHHSRMDEAVSERAGGKGSQLVHHKEWRHQKIMLSRLWDIEWGNRSWCPRLRA